MTRPAGESGAVESLPTSAEQEAASAVPESGDRSEPAVVDGPPRDHDHGGVVDAAEHDRPTAHDAAAAEEGPAPAGSAAMSPAAAVVSAERAPSRAGAREVAAAICPYLASSGGSWRMATPSREHRCIGLSPALPQSADKQRRHCLSAAHIDCGIYRAARDVRAATLAGGADPARIVAADAKRRPLPRTAPILLEQPHLLDQAARLQLDRAPGQLALVALMVLAFAIVALSRISSPAQAGPSPAPSAFAAAPTRGASPSPSVPVPSASLPVASTQPSASPGPSFRTTYTVKKGDTLSGIAKRFKTTVAALQKLNGLTSGPLRVGQVVKIP
jgi:LysM repeat protein